MSKDTTDEKELEKMVEEKIEELLHCDLDRHVFDECWNFQPKNDKLFKRLNIIAAKSKKEKMRLIDEALQESPGDLEFLLLRIQTEYTDFNKIAEELEKLILVAEDQMKKAGYYPKEIGNFYTIEETRPYIDLLDAYLYYLIPLGRLSKAIEEAEYILKLNECDDLGTRYTAMHLFAYTENEQKALSFLKNYDEDSSNMLLPMSILYYRKGDLKKAGEYLRELNGHNRYLKKFLQMLNRNIQGFCNPLDYQPNTLEELVTEYFDNTFLFTATPYFASWAIDELKKK